MRKAQKKQAEEFVELLGQVHKVGNCETSSQSRLKMQ